VTWALHHPGYVAVFDHPAARKCAAGPSMPVRGTQLFVSIPGKFLNSATKAAVPLWF
jgi:hypothetical protein